MTGPYIDIKSRNLTTRYSLQDDVLAELGIVRTAISKEYPLTQFK